MFGRTDSKNKLNLLEDMPKFNVGDYIKKIGDSSNNIFKVLEISDSWNFIVVYSNEQGYLSVYDCQNYELTLPEKWYVKRDEKNYIIINRWLNETSGVPGGFIQMNGYVYYPKYEVNGLINTYTYTSVEIVPGYDEITFSQFKRFIWKEPIKRHIKLTRKDAKV